MAPTVAASSGRTSPRSAGRGWLFIVVFVGAVGAFYVFSQLGVFTQVVAPASSRLSAVAAGPFIRLFGDQVQVIGSTISSSKGQVEVAYGCDALEPIVFLVAAILAFPAPWRWRFAGIMAGIPALFALNIVRIVSLYYIASRRSDWFETAHRDVWQPLFIVGTLGLWFAWVMLLPKPRRDRPASA